MAIQAFFRLMVMFFALSSLAGCGGSGGGGSNPVYSVSGIVAGLPSGQTVVLQNNGYELPVSGDSFSFSVEDRTGYHITVKTQPSGRTCSVSNNSGGISGADVTNVMVTCVWTKQMGAVNGDYFYSAGTFAKALATDPFANVYVAGYTEGELDGNPMMSGYQDYFLVKYDAGGNKIYAHQEGASGTNVYAVAHAVTTDQYGSAFVAGGTSGGLDGNVSAGYSDYFLAKYDENDLKSYTKQVGVADQGTVARSVLTDASGNVYVVGETNAGLDGNTLIGRWDVFITKYGIDDAHVYTTQSGASESIYDVGSAAIDADGNIFVAGVKWTYGYYSFFLTKFDGSTGGVLATKSLGAAGSNYHDAFVAVDGAGNVLVTGYADFDPGQGTCSPFFMKYDNALTTKVYEKTPGANADCTRPLAVAADENGNVFVAGGTNGGIEGNVLTGSEDYFLIKYDADGTLEYARQGGVAGHVVGATAVATDAEGNVFVAGDTTGGLDGNTQTGSVDFFLVKYDSGGTKQ